jgi:hypothetical protein
MAMNDNKVVSLEAAYRRVAQELPTMALDESIVDAARRHTASRRAWRQAGAALVVAALAAVAAILRQPGIQLPHQTIQPPAGYMEGQTRAYLLETAGSRSSTPVALYLTSLAASGASPQFGVPSNAKDSTR